jgi:hypothetical protein
VVCSVCGSSDGRAISDDTAHKLLIKFFQHGSESLVVAGHVPLYNLTPDRSFMSGEFESPLDDDYQLMLDHYGLGVFHNAPAAWRMGMTDHYHELSALIPTPLKRSMRLFAQLHDTSFPHAPSFIALEPTSAQLWERRRHTMHRRTQLSVSPADTMIPISRYFTLPLISKRAFTNVVAR